MDKAVAVFLFSVAMFATACGDQDIPSPVATSGVEPTSESAADEVAVESPGNQSNGRIAITNEEESLATRVTITSKPVPIRPSPANQTNRLYQWDPPGSSSFVFVSLRTTLFGDLFQNHPKPEAESKTSSIGPIGTPARSRC
jgi:hypothetical protein